MIERIKNAVLAYDVELLIAAAFVCVVFIWIGG